MNIKRPRSTQPIPRNAKKVYKGVLFDVYQWKQKMFDGNYKVFEKVKRPDTVNVIPITNNGKIIMTEQRQVGTKSFVGVPGGRIDKNENIEKAFQRELLEETGYISKKGVLWEAEYLDSKIDWVIYTIIARNCTKVINQNLDSGEQVKLLFVDFDEFIDLILSDRCRDKEIAFKILKAMKNKKEWRKTKRLLSA